MRILQINTVSNSRSTGRIAEGIGKAIQDSGWSSYVASGSRLSGKSQVSEQIYIGSETAYKIHAAGTRLTDAHGFFSYLSTKRFLKKVQQLNPDLVHLHNLHGYYLNLPLLFSFLQETRVPVVWTMHDCWAFTGHCAFYNFVSCDKWKSQCFKCPQTSSYPKSFVDGSARNFKAKKRLYAGLERLTICTPSDWLKGQVEQSFLGKHPVHTVNNGIDLSAFREIQGDFRMKHGLANKKVILGVASEWSARKGLQDFVRLHGMLPEERFKIVIVGADELQCAALPADFVTVKRTESREKLAEIYSAADYFFNPTYEDTFPTTNIEALACGTPVITYRTGGSPEIIDEQTGWVVEKGDLAAVQALLKSGDTKNSRACRLRAEDLYNEKHTYLKYVELYKSYF